MDEEPDFRMTYATAIALLAELLPPPGASEAWVRAKAVEIDAIAREQCLARPVLAQALFHAGVAQARDRSKPIQAQNVGRAVLAGVRFSNSHKSAVDSAKVEKLVVATLGRMFPTAMNAIDRLVGGVDLSSVAPIPVQAPTAAAPVPAQAPTAPARKNDFAATAEAMRAATTSPKTDPPKSQLDDLFDRPINELLMPKKDSSK